MKFCGSPRKSQGEAQKDQEEVQEPRGDPPSCFKVLWSSWAFL